MPASGEILREALMRIVGRKKLTKLERERIAAENETATGVNVELAATRRRRRLSSLLVGGRSVLGAPSGRGAPSGAGAAGGGGRGTVLGSGGGYQPGGSYQQSRSYGGSLSRL